MLCMPGFYFEDTGGRFMAHHPSVLSMSMQEDAPLTMVRLRVVKLLGHLGGKLNRNLITGMDSDS